MTQRARGWSYAALGLLYGPITVLMTIGEFVRRGGGRLTPTATALFVEHPDGAVAFMPWARILIWIVTSTALLHCARTALRGDPLARLAAFFTGFGLLLPQGWFFSLFLVEFRAFPVPAALGCGLALSLVIALLFSPRGVFADERAPSAWTALSFGRSRLLWLGLFLFATFYGCEAYLAFFYYIPSRAGLVTGLATLILSALSIFGLFRLRTWTLLSSLLLGALSTVWLTSARTESIAHGFLPTRSWLALPGLGSVASIPLLAILILTWPFLRSLARRLRSDDPDR